MTGVIVLILRIFLAVALYGFVGFVIYTIWQELRSNSQFIRDRSFPTLIVTQVDSDPPAVRSFGISEVLIGRDPNCLLTISNEMVSAQHARLSYHHNQWWVEDLHSTNGTFLNGERVYTPTVLVAGDEMTLGRVNLEISFRERTRVPSGG